MSFIVEVYDEEGKPLNARVECLDPALKDLSHFKVIVDTNGFDFFELWDKGRYNQIREKIKGHYDIDWKIIFDRDTELMIIKEPKNRCPRCIDKIVGTRLGIDTSNCYIQLSEHCYVFNIEKLRELNQ